MTSTPTLPEIKTLLQRNVEALASALLPQGKRNGAWWMACNPRRGEKKPSLGVGIGGAAPGAWKDFGGDAKGDVLDLIAYLNDFPALKTDPRPTLEWACGFLGLNGAAPVTVRHKIAEASAAQKARDLQAADEAETNRRRAKALYLASRERPFLPSPAATYLSGRRGIDLARLGKIPGCLGWLPDAWHTESGQRWPVMVAGFQNDAGATIAVHRTFLTADGSDKAPVPSARKIWPAGYTGSAIRLWRGAKGLALAAALKAYEKHGACETLALVEGVEDGLSLALACPDLRIWAAGSLHNLGHITVPPCCDRVVVCADNDWGKPQAEAQFRIVLDRLAAQGCHVSVARATTGKDVNDQLRG